MSRTGRGERPSAKGKQREVQERIAEAAAQHRAAEEQQEAYEREQRVGRLFVMCRQRVHGRLLCLWPGDALGWYIGEQMINEAMHRVMVEARERLAVAP